MPRAPRARLKRIDAAIDAVKPMGFPEPLIRKTVRNLLKAYGGDEGWIFIEEFSYKLLIDSILEEVEEKNSVLRSPENSQPTLMIEKQVSSAQPTLMIENQVSKESNDRALLPLVSHDDNTDQYNEHSNQVEPSRSSSPPLKKRAVQVNNPSNSSTTLTLAVPCSSKEETSEVKCRKQTALSKVSAGIRSLQVKVCSETKNVSTETRSQLFSPAIVESRLAQRRKPCYGWLSSDEDDEPD